MLKHLWYKKKLLLVSCSDYLWHFTTGKQCESYWLSLLPLTNLKNSSSPQNGKTQKSIPTLSVSVSIQHRVITSRVFHENYTGGAYHDYDVVIVCWDEALEFNEAIQVNDLKLYGGIVRFFLNNN